MLRHPTSSFVSALVGLVLLALPALARAQARDAADAARQAERSRAIQAALAHVDAHRAEFVRELLMEWSAYVDPAIYDLFGTLEPIALRAPAWQLYGASLVGDFATMVRILRGEEGAGPYVDALAGRPEALRAHQPAWEVVEPDAFPTDTAANLVYVPIAPCRVVDTRGAGARQGVIPANGSRAFDLTTAAFTSGQGASGPCPGLPASGPAAWSVNLTVTGYSALGGLKAWGFGGAEPNASVINYAPGVAALANGLILTGCVGCADDIVVKAFTAGTHVIVDVTGFFRPAEVASSFVTRVAGTTTAVPAGGRQYVNGGSCPGGTRLVTGEADHVGSDVSLGESEIASASTWRYWIINNDPFAVNVTVYSRCLDTPIRAAP